MSNLGFSTYAIKSLLEKEDWVDIYQKELNKRLSGLYNVKDKFPEKRFLDIIKPQLDNIFQKELEENSVDIRESIQRWMLIAHFKFYSLIKHFNQMPKELLELENIQKEYSDIPIGPQDEETINQMTEEEIRRWHEGNIALAYAGISLTNLYGVFVSELFFTIEAMLRAVCIGSCLGFAIKSIDPKITIQHDEIFKTLRRLGNEKNSIYCKLCPITEKKCSFEDFSKLADLYELFYHIRAIKDYRKEFYFKEGLQEFLIDYMKKSFEAACVIDEIMAKLFQDYLGFPLTLKEEKEKIIEIISAIK